MSGRARAVRVYVCARARARETAFVAQYQLSSVLRSTVVQHRPLVIAQHQQSWAQRTQCLKGNMRGCVVLRVSGDLCYLCEMTLVRVLAVTVEEALRRVLCLPSDAAKFRHVGKKE